MKALVAIVALDLRLALSDGGAIYSLIFFALTITVFAIAVGPDLGQLSAIAAPVIWASALFACLMSLDRIFRADFEDGALDILATRFGFLAPVVLAKAAGCWLTTALPLIVAAPLFGLLLGLPPAASGPLVISLALGTPALSLIGAVAAAVTLAMRRAGVLTTLLTLPLYMPVLIFGVSAAEAGLGPDGAATERYIPSLLLLGAMSLFLSAVAPFAGAAAIRANLD